MSEEIQEALRRLKLRLSSGEIDEASYDRLKEKILADLPPDERATLDSSTPAPVTPGAARSGVTGFGPGGRLGPSGATGGGMRTSIPSLAELSLGPGTVLLGQWRLERELGRGGFGAVFEAEELHLHEKQAVKVLDPAMVAKEELLARFRREVSLMRKLVHPRIVRVYDYREDPGQLVALISMELVSGGSVRQVVAEARRRGVAVPIPLALKILEQTLEALAEAHRQGVIHRDVTPGNVLLAGGSAEQLLAEPGGDPEGKLVDFGIAGLVERTELSQKSRVLGTAAYVAPEVLDPNVEVTPAADVYGAGAMAYELLTGSLPLGRFKGPSALRSEISPPTDELVLALLETSPMERPVVEEALSWLRELVPKGGVGVAIPAPAARASIQAPRGVETPLPCFLSLPADFGATLRSGRPGSDAEMRTRALRLCAQLELAHRALFVAEASPPGVMLERRQEARVDDRGRSVLGAIRLSDSARSGLRRLLEEAEQIVAPSRSPFWELFQKDAQALEASITQGGELPDFGDRDGLLDRLSLDVHELCSWQKAPIAVLERLIRHERLPSEREVLSERRSCQCLLLLLWAHVRWVSEPLAGERPTYPEIPLEPLRRAGLIPSFRASLKAVDSWWGRSAACDTLEMFCGLLEASGELRAVPLYSDLQRVTNGLVYGLEQKIVCLGGDDWWCWR